MNLFPETCICVSSHNRGVFFIGPDARFYLNPPFFSSCAVNVLRPVCLQGTMDFPSAFFLALPALLIAIAVPARIPQASRVVWTRTAFRLSVHAVHYRKLPSE